MQSIKYRHSSSLRVKKFKTFMSTTKVMFTIFWVASGVLYTEFLSKGLLVNSDRYCAILRSLKQSIYRMRPKRNEFFFASRQCKTTLQCTDTGRHGKTEIHSSSTTYLKLRFDTVGLFVVFKIEGNVERSTFYNGCQSSGSHAQMDTQPTKILLH
ncbi:hypothetical protein TNCV_1048501 [Trichonephila clavipes]|nr:hypothetical protein TNCV_1048501 [Trichonephila clavipes]